MRIRQLLTKRLYRSYTLGELLYLSVWWIFMTVIWSRMLVFDGTYYWAGWINVWGDWSAHITYITNLAYRPLFPLVHPLFAGAPFRYHFVADYISALLLRNGLSLVQATIIPSTLLSYMLIFSIYIFFRSLFHSYKTAMLATLLFFFNGGLGFIHYVIFLFQKNPILYTYPPLFQWTQIDNASIHYINFITDIFIPQRPFLLGMPITVCILLFLWRNYETSWKSRYRSWFFIGCLAGLLPIIHIHSFWIIMIVGIYLMVLDITKRTSRIHWIAFFSTALLLSIPQLLFFTENISRSFIHLEPLWMAQGNFIQWMWFWLNNIGIMFFLIPLSYKFAPKKILWFSIPFLMLFVAANFIIFQPYEWDNRKFFIYWYLMGTGLVAHAIVSVWRTTTQYVVKSILLLLVILATFSGFQRCIQFDSIYVSVLQAFFRRRYNFC